jgi:sigma-B regulation protein RsbU (phosphoserine phosphatase)
MQDQIDISILSLDIDSDQARNLPAAITDAWPTSQPLHCRFSTEGRITASLVDSCDALLLHCGTRVPTPQLLMELMTLRDTSLPIIVLGGDESTRTQCRMNDIFVLDLDSEAAAIAGILAGATYRAGEVSSLLHETGQTRNDYSRIDRRLSKLNRELEDAAHVQQQFLPARTLDVPGGTVTTLWRPAGHVSGDGCAVHQINDRTTVLFLADAIGHGVPAAMLSIMLQRVLLDAIRHDGADTIDEPGLLLRRLNEALLQRRSGNTRFATAACAVFDADTNTLELASAGHPPLLRTQSDGRIASLAATGSLLGVFEDEHYATSVIQLDAGDRIVLYSDGIEEACRDTADEAGAAALARCCTRWSSTTHFVEAMEEHVTANHARRMHEERDDLTLICLDLDATACAERRAA